MRMVRQIPRLKAVAVPRVSFLACLIQWMKTDSSLWAEHLCGPRLEIQVSAG
jgi:hypothetical protein